MKNNEKKIIWFFKEPRSGSSWLSHALADKLSRPVVHVDKQLFELKQEMGNINESLDSLNNKLLSGTVLTTSGSISYNDTNWCYATHRFEVLASLGIYKDPILLIRSIRRNLTELILSRLAVDISGWRLVHMYKDPMKNALPNHTLNNLIKNPVVVAKPDLMKYMLEIKQRDELWDAYSKNFENYTIVYEDLQEGVNLPIYEGTIKFGDYDDDIIKTPDYKRDMFSNYDQVVDWVNEFAHSMKNVR